MIKIQSYLSDVSGPRLVVLGAVHGNETCGATAIGRMIAALESGQVVLTRGQIHFVPVCNPRAFAQQARFIDRNLNRYLVWQDEPDCYEARLGNILVPLLESADVLLDLHSSPRGDEPYVFVGPPNADEYAYAAALGLRTLMTGWEGAYARTGRNPATCPAEGIGTEQVVRQKGKLAALVECGVHDDPAAAAVAFRAVSGALAYWGMASGVDVPPRPVAPQRLFEMTHVFYRDGDGAFAKPWRDFDAVTKGEVLARLASGETLVAPDDGAVLLPDPVAQIGQEWIYFGVERPLNI